MEQLLDGSQRFRHNNTRNLQKASREVFNKQSDAIDQTQSANALYTVLARNQNKRHLHESVEGDSLSDALSRYNR